MTASEIGLKFKSCDSVGDCRQFLGVELVGVPGFNPELQPDKARNADRDNRQEKPNHFAPIKAGMMFSSMSKDASRMALRQESIQMCASLLLSSLPTTGHIPKSTETVIRSNFLPALERVTMGKLTLSVVFSVLCFCFMLSP